MPQSSIFPIFLRAQYRDDGQAFSRFQSDAQRAAMAAKREFQGVSAAISAALTSPRTGGGSLDLGTGQLREQIRAQEQAAIAAREIAAATLQAARANGTFNAALTPTIKAYREVAAAKDAEVAASRAQLAALEQVQAQLNQTASATTVLTGENLRLAQAEAGAANGATLLTAILRGTALEQGRVTISARESAAAFQQAFAAQDAYAASVAALRAQINPAAAAQQEFNQKVAFADAALNRGELSQQEYARAVQLASAALRQAGQAEVAAAAARNGLTSATRAGTTARGNVINSIRAERTAFTQLGQQLQDVGVQYQSGTNLLTILTQQLPQASFALSGLADSADKTKARIGQFATVLSGPLGGAIVIATALLGPLILKLFETEGAAGAAARSVEELVNEKIKSAAEARNAAIAEDVFARTLVRAVAGGGNGLRREISNFPTVIQNF